MRHLLFIVLLLACANANAQAPQSFNYQAVVRDAAGNILGGTAVSFQISIHEGSAGGAIVYSETHSETTNMHGLVNFQIGTGTIVSGIFSGISWGSNSFFLQVELDVSGGSSYSDMGTTQLISVPYALHAETVEVDAVDDADNDPTNEHNTSVTLVGTDLEVTDGGGTITTDLSSLQDGVIDADSDPTNEIELPASATAGDVLTYDGSSWGAAAPAASGAGGSVMYIYDDQSCPSGWTKQEINVAIWGGAAVDACWTDSPCQVMYIYDGQVCPSGWSTQLIGAAVINSTTTPVDACYKCN